MTSYFAGDQPGSIVVPIDALSLAADATVSAVSASLSGQTLPATVDTDEQTIVVSLEPDTFAAAGLYPLSFRLTFADGSTESFAVEDIVVQQPDGWHSLESARGQWTDAPVSDEILFTLLSAARHQCEEFAPAFDGFPPLRYRQAQLMQVRALWQSTKSNSAGEIGEGGFAVQVFPMDWTIKALLRPRRGTPVIA